MPHDGMETRESLFMEVTEPSEASGKKPKQEAISSNSRIGNERVGRRWL